MQRKPPPPPPKQAPSPPKKVQAVSAFDASNPTHVHVPESTGGVFDHIVNNYVNAIATTATFDTSKPCAVCDKPGHTFDDCPVLQNVEFLRKHYIQFKLFLKRQSLASATINHVSAESNDGYDAAYDTDYDDTDHPFNDNPISEDFHQGRE